MTTSAGEPKLPLTTVDTVFGRLVGSTEAGVSRFLGVPYAAPPFGPRRLRPPEPPAPWSGERDATRYGPTALKSGYPVPFDQLLPEPQIPGEDCLNLNIWTPDCSGRRPVFVWIHGGGFLNGSGAVPQYDGTAFARDGVVCVTINYRLGADGFLDTGDDDTATNLGILDQIAALQWVQKSISGFGGDPGEVTVGGESAGAMSVATLLASPLTGGLFRRAVLQSGAGHHAIGRATAQKVAAEVAARLGVEPTRQAIAGAPVEDLLRVQAEIGQEVQLAPDFERWGEVVANLMAFEPVIDGDVVPGLPVQQLGGGANSEVEVLIGTNAEENLLFMQPTGALDLIDDQMLRMAAVGYGFADPDDVIALYAKESGDSPGRTMAALATDWFFRIPAIRLAEARAGGPGRSWMYELTWKSRARGGVLGACHALDLPFVFDTLGADGSDWITGSGAPQPLADEMHGSWVRFVTTGDPGWEPYTPARRAVRLFGVPSTTTEDPGADRRLVWEGRR